MWKTQAETIWHKTKNKGDFERGAQMQGEESIQQKRAWKLLESV
jgi:hypothetical protein